MNLENTLEEDILKVLWGAFDSLSTLEIWETLESRKIKVPVNYLNQVIRAMVQLELLEIAGSRDDYQTYRPAISALRFYRNPLKAIQRYRNKRNNTHSKLTTGK